MMKLYNVTVTVEHTEEIEVEREEEEFEDPEAAAQSLAEQMVATDIANGSIPVESFEIVSNVEEVDR